MQKTRRVQLLDPWVAERIAAGEVIERPSSVVKELVENAIDAGASEIEVRLEDGGKALIQVTDNGSGIHHEDLKLAIQRHATSKIQSLDDLERLRTLGFRGEALPSISAASELSIISRARDEAQAYELHATSGNVGEVTQGHFLHSPHGTVVSARGLFSMIPARLKFLKSASAEVTQVREWIERLALSHPAVSFTLLSDERKLVDLRATTEKDRVLQVLGGGEDYPVVTQEIKSVNEDLGMSLRVHWLQGLSLPQARRLVQVVNGRALKDRLLQAAVIQSFKQALLPGQFPAVAVYLEIPPQVIDVNVHPTKTEVRFLDSSKIFRAVEKLCSQLIEKQGAPAILAPTRVEPVAIQTELPAAQWQAPQRWHETPMLMSSPEVSAPPPATLASLPHPALRWGLDLHSNRFVGILFSTYIAYDTGTELVLIDQHAAHERVRYERFKAQTLSGAAQASQQLLIPEAVKVDRDRLAELTPKLKKLTTFGFDWEPFGEEQILFRGVPGAWLDAGIHTQQLKMRLANLMERLLEEDQLDLIDHSLFEKIASQSCHGAIRARDSISREQAIALVEDLFECEHPWNCPHGRPTTVRVPEPKLEEWFQRIVPS